MEKRKPDASRRRRRFYSDSFRKPETAPHRSKNRHKDKNRFGEPTRIHREILLSRNPRTSRAPKTVAFVIRARPAFRGPLNESNVMESCKWRCG